MKPEAEQGQGAVSQLSQRRSLTASLGRSQEGLPACTLEDGEHTWAGLADTFPIALPLLSRQNYQQYSEE